MNFIEAIRLQYVPSEAKVKRTECVSILKEQKQQEIYVWINDYVDGQELNNKYKIALILYKANCMGLLLDYIKLGYWYKKRKKYMDNNMK